MAQRCDDVVGIARSWIAANWNTKTASISAAVVTSGLAVVGLYWYLMKSDRARRVEAEALIPVVVEYDRRMATRKRQLFDELVSLKRVGADGRLVILEIGSGCGTNLAYYPVGSDVICVEPNEHLKAALYDSARQHPGVKISAYHVTSAEKVPDVESASVDAVVSTAVLCSVGDPDQCLREIVRILKPGGKFFFMEHVKAPPQFYVVRFVQVLFDFVWSIMSGGCHLARSTKENIRKAGFRSVKLEEFEAHELVQPTKLMYAVRLVRSHISGTATK